MAFDCFSVFMACVGRGLRLSAYFPFNFRPLLLVPIFLSAYGCARLRMTGKGEKLVWHGYKRVTAFVVVSC